ncbi:glutamine synthetase family protein [Neolewinella antarctica]|uniref:Glutamine synthetase n=1 Tax=Neolewinella antarctica TaxID=442734 RepID=A0ABX0XC44_9BACT|nr:glutamine synthetase [Neolewinella antarctica]NJC26757.1 glutamine synthetase [Neolewinella antarctica]
MQSTRDWLEKSNAPFVKIGVTDIDGILRTKYISRDKVMRGLDDGLSFCNVVFQWDAQDELYGNGLADPAFGDSPVTVVAGSQRTIPWENDVPFLLADFSSASGSDPAVACPRSLLRSVVERAEGMGFTARFGPEYEWFAYRETPDSLADKQHQNLRPITPGMFGYSGLRTGALSTFHHELFRQITAFGVDLEGLHTETGPGALEAALVHQTALEAADRAVLFKEGVKQISYRHGFVASFMAKQQADLPGCGGHLHQSLWREDVNAFYDEARPHGMSKTFEHYLAGQLFWLPKLMPLYAPNVNSYKRYVAGSWAATRANWGVDNRTVALRVIPGGPKSTRLETRIPGADANPYLVIAAALASGLYGIEHGLELTTPAVVGSAYEQSVGEELPKDLGAGAGAMRAGLAQHNILAPAFSAHFLKTREWEWSRYQRAVTDWERQRYFELA